MTSSDTPVPPAGTVQAALRKTTEVLASELAHPTSVAPDWPEFEWRAARAVAAMHGVSPLLASTLRWQGPPGWARFLEEQRAHTVSRHRRIEELLHLIDSRAREESLAMVGLKGIALHAIGVYAAGDRPMADLDLLVREADMERASRMLETLGFHESFVCWKHRVFAPDDDRAPASLGEHSGNNIKIELHWRVGEMLPLRATDISELVFPPQPHPGLNAYPSKASLMIHLLLHAAGAMASRNLRLLHLHDLALLCAQMTSADWSEILRHAPDDRGPWWALPPLLLTARYYSSPVPASVLAAMALACPRLLSWTTRRRTVSDVSLSDLWVEAFPGIEWSRSVREMLRYAVSRVRPNEAAYTLREDLARTELWASHSQWYRLSQLGRVVHWLTSRPTRVATMYAIRAALAQPQ